MGAKGVFALDVTTPEHFMEGRRALFEFTEKDDPDVGYITSAPVIAKISNGKNKEGYFVVVSSGYESSNGIGDNFLFLLSLDKDPSSPWIANSNYYKISTGNRNRANVLGAPGLALNVQGAATYAYAGDLLGNLWRFDFSSDNLASIVPKIIFSAKDKNDNPQPISTQPVIAFAPDGGYLVLFGTGDNSEQPRQNSFYAIRDTKKNTQADYFITGRSQLAKRTLVQKKIGFDITGDNFRYGSEKKGWYVDYPKTGERSISEALIANGNIFFNTTIPNTNSCPTSGSSVSYKMDVLTGKLTDQNSLTGMPQLGIVGAPILLYMKPTLGERDALGRRSSIQPYSLAYFGNKEASSSPEVINTKESVHLKAGRLSWHEIANWQDMLH